MSTPLVTICLPNLNNRVFLPERLDTIFAQTVSDWELVVVDNHSDDGAWEYFQDRARTESRMRISQAPRKGMYANWNNCLQLARGEYIYFATSDDTMSPTALEELLKPMVGNPAATVSVCNHERIDEHGARIPVPKQKVEEFLGEWAFQPCLRDGTTEFLLLACFGHIWVTMTAVLFRRSILEKTGLFRTDMGSTADVEWGLRAALTGRVAWNPQSLATWRIHSSQASAATWTPALRRMMRDALQRVLEDPDSGIPAHWKKKEGWDRDILSMANALYYEPFDLYRWILRKHPARFLKGMKLALQMDPQWLMKCAARGFGEGEENRVRAVETMKQLCKTFAAPWPPEPAPAGPAGIANQRHD